MGGRKAAWPSKITFFTKVGATSAKAETFGELRSHPHNSIRTLIPFGLRVQLKRTCACVRALLRACVYASVNS
jgi:hypothetical protein